MSDGYAELAAYDAFIEELKQFCTEITNDVGVMNSAANLIVTATDGKDDVAKKAQLKILKNSKKYLEVVQRAQKLMSDVSKERAEIARVIAEANNI